MNREKFLLVSVLSAVAVISIFTGVGSSAEEHPEHDHPPPQFVESADNHNGHDHQNGHGEHDDHSDQGTHDDHDTHGEHDQDAEAHDHTEGEDEGVELSEAQQQEIGLRIRKAEGGDLDKELAFVGEVRLNQDRVSHIIPSVPGIVTSVHKSLGDSVVQGETLAVLRSVELAEAKSDYFEAYNEVDRSIIDLNRAREVTANTEKLLRFLKDAPSFTEIRGKQYGDMGSYRTSLLSSYSELFFAEKTFTRKKRLFDDKIASESDFLEAQNAYEKAQAEFDMALDNARFEIHQKLIEEQRTVRVNEFKLKTAERKLEVLGLTEEQIRSLVVKAGLAGDGQVHHCTDSNCSDCKSRGEKDVKNHASAHPHDQQMLAFAEIAVKAPFPGVVVERHITLGEKLDEGSAIFTIADLSDVWIDLQIPARDADNIAKHMNVDVDSGNGQRGTGTIHLAMPVVNEETRTALARVTLDNRAGIWKPGTFVTGRVRTASTNLKVVIEAEAIQNIEGQDVVFVPAEHGFKTKPIVVGKRDRRRVQILSGLSAGEAYVSRGAFELKAVMVTSGAGAHAGHGH